MVRVSKFNTSTLNLSFLGTEASPFNMLDFLQSRGHLFYYFQRVNLQFCPKIERNSPRNKRVNMEVYLNSLLIKSEVFGSLRSIRWYHFCWRSAVYFRFFSDFSTILAWCFLDSAKSITIYISAFQFPLPFFWSLRFMPFKILCCHISGPSGKCGG